MATPSPAAPPPALTTSYPPRTQSERYSFYPLSKQQTIQKAVQILYAEEQRNLSNFGGEEKLPPPPRLNEEEEQRLWRKIDKRLLPILSLMYLMAFLDRGNIGNAKLQGLTDQLSLRGMEYNVALTIFFIPYCIFECPANLVLKKFRPSRWLPGITILWGIVMTCGGIVKNYPQLVAVRLCLGFAEAGLFPGITYYLTLWYPRFKLQYRVGMFVGSAAMSGAFSGLVAYAISFMSGAAGLDGWSWIFILEGIGSVCVGVLACFVLVDFPGDAEFLTPEERAFVVWRKKYDNSSVGEEERFAFKHVWSAFSDWQIWLHLLIYISIIGPLYGITLFIPSIIAGLGYGTAMSQLLTVPPYVFATGVLLYFAHHSDMKKRRSVFILFGLCMLLIGFCINISDASVGAKYFGTFFCVGGAYGAFPAVIAWLGNNLAGQYKRAVGMALHIGLGNFSGAIAANVYRQQDEPRYIFGHGLMLMFIGIGFLSVPLAMYLYDRINDERDELERQQLKAPLALRRIYSIQSLRDLGDRAPDFRYSL